MYVLRLLAIICLLFSNLSSFAQERFNIDEEIQLPVANWDFVPHQVLSSPINIGLLAFHSSGIKRVDFYLNEKFNKSVSEAKFNPDSKVKEYFINIDPISLPEGFSLINAVVHAYDGSKRDLVPISIFINKHESITNEFYVSNTGSDVSGNGSRDNPYKTISEALKNVPIGSELVLSEPGTYFLTGQVRRNIADKWTTIKGNSTYKRDQFVLSMPAREKVRLMMDKIKFQNLTLDFAGIATIFPENDHSVWFDNVIWTDSNFNEKSTSGVPPLNYPINFGPVRSNKQIKGYYVTNSIATHTFWGFVSALLARNVQVDNILGDAFSNAKLVINANISDIVGNETDIHSDIFQYWGQHDNVIVYNVKATNLGGERYRAKYNKVLVSGLQNFFLGDSNTTLTNFAFVNICMSNLQNPKSKYALKSQLSGIQSNILFENVTTLNQFWAVRNDLQTAKKFIGKSILFKNSRLAGFGSGIRKQSIPLNTGVSFINTDTNFRTADSNYCEGIIDLSMIN